MHPLPYGGILIYRYYINVNRIDRTFFYALEGGVSPKVLIANIPNDYRTYIAKSYGVYSIQFRN